MNEKQQAATAILAARNAHPARFVVAYPGDDAEQMRRQAQKETPLRQVNICQVSIAEAGYKGPLVVVTHE